MYLRGRPYYLLDETIQVDSELGPQQGPAFVFDGNAANLVVGLYGVVVQGVLVEIVLQGPIVYYLGQDYFPVLTHQLDPQTNKYGLGVPRRKWGNGFVTRCVHVLRLNLRRL